MPERYTLTKPRIGSIALIGTGLIGGSLGLSWKRYRPDLRIVGFDEGAVLERALERGAIDAGAASAAAAAEAADLVVLAVPISRILPLLSELDEHLREGAWVTDVGSVKRPVMDHAASALSDHAVFVGGHPMAGSEHRGIDHADALLFENATYVLCPPPGITEHEFRNTGAPFIDLISATGARVLLLEAERHDRIAAAISHLPQLLAVALVDYVASLNETDDAFLRLAAGGFRDLTRIASSPYALWRDILLANEGPVLDVLAGFAATVQRTRNRIIEEDFSALEDTFNRARRVRETIPRDSKGFLHPLSDVYVYAEDRPGVLLDITRRLFEVDLNIQDIELLKIREGTGGAFRMSFADSTAADRAVAALTSSGITAYRLEPDDRNT